MATLNKVLVIRGQNNNYTTVYFLEEAMRDNETQDDFISRETSRILSGNPLISPSDIFVKTKSELRNVIANSTLRSKRHIKCDALGNLYEDVTFKTERQLLDDRRELIRQKLKSGTLLDDSDIDTLFGKVT